MVAFADTEVEALSGVILTSLSSGLGEQSFLSYSSQFNKYIIYFLATYYPRISKIDQLKK